MISIDIGMVVYNERMDLFNLFVYKYQSSKIDQFCNFYLQVTLKIVIRVRTKRFLLQSQTKVLVVTI